MSSIDNDLQLILSGEMVLTGGAKKKNTSSIKKTKKKTKSVDKISSKKRSSVKRSSVKRSSVKKVKNTKRIVEAANLIKDNENELLSSDVETFKSEYSKSSDKKLQERPRVVKKSADENKEYISVKAEKLSKSDNTYKPYDVAFLKRLQRSRTEMIASEENSE